MGSDDMGRAVPRRARHKSAQHKDLGTADAILAIAEDLCAKVGPQHVKLSDIASQLQIETPSIYKHFKGRDGVLSALVRRAIEAELATFEGLDDLPVEAALRLQSERLFTLHLTRPGVVRLILTDFAIPGGLSAFDENQELIATLYEKEERLLNQGIREKVLRPVSISIFVSARLGPLLTLMALKNVYPAKMPLQDEAIQEEFIKLVMASLLAD
ncbi:hypothetical protein C2W62_23840 [Candidatus Entotheonella serta]|nr:hypothetical protein C2W62_23840 [Candidatus Entotheonella serta]